MGDMQVIAQQHLQGVFARWQRNFSLGAAITKVDMMLIRWNRQSQVR